MMAVGPEFRYLIDMDRPTTAPYKKPSTWKNEPYKLVELRAAAAPDGGTDGKWFRYVSSQGGTPIEGLRQGSKASVTAAVEEFITSLNERRLGGSSHWRPAAGAKRGRPPKNGNADAE